MRLRLLRFGVMLFGAFLMYAALSVVANCEEMQLYSLRRAITGMTAPFDIRNHPADKWIIPAVVVTLCPIGAVLAAVTFETIRHVRKRPAE